MTLFSLACMIGCLALSLVVSTRRPQIKSSSSPWIMARLRIASISLILLLAGCGGLRPALSPSPSVAAPAAVLPSIGLSGATPASSQAPVLEAIQTHLASTSIGAVILADIRFHDPDGDAYEIAYTVVGSSVPGVTVPSEQITATQAEQVAGTDQVLEWPCQGSSAIVALKAVILDKAGHRSNIFPFVLDCG